MSEKKSRGKKISALVIFIFFDPILYDDDGIYNNNNTITQIYLYSDIYVILYYILLYIYECIIIIYYEHRRYIFIITYIYIYKIYAVVTYSTHCSRRPLHHNDFAAALRPSEIFIYRCRNIYYCYCS